MTRFLLIRHATNDAIGKCIAGRAAGLHLNEEGQQQAQQLAERLAQLPVAAIYSSPLERTMETAAPTANKHNLSIITCDDFIELDYGAWTNKTIIEIKQSHLFSLFNTFRSGTRIPGGELMLEAQTRMIAGLEKLKTQHPQQTVAVFSHADPIKAALAYFIGMPLDGMQRIEISPASVSVLELYDETARLLVMNDTGALRF